MTRQLSSFSRVVIKIGSALLVNQSTGAMRRDWLGGLAKDIALLRAAGTEVIVVSSGAIALGRGKIASPDKILRLEEDQAAAAIGQISLSRAYSEEFGRHNITSAQILLTLGDTEERRRYLNARSTLSTLLQHGIIPVINENDTVATSEIRYGDNDRLAARVTAMTSADCLVLLSDVDGLFTLPPGQPGADFVDNVPQITFEIEAMAGNSTNPNSRGGMRTKIDAAKIATAAGATMIIASGKKSNPISRINKGGKATWFAASSSPITARKAWIAGHLETHGTLTIDKGAAQALTRGKSLLPAGVTAISGKFSRGDAVKIVDGNAHEIARGLVAYDQSDAARLIGQQSSKISILLGYDGRAEIIHRDDLVLMDEVPLLKSN